MCTPFHPRLPSLFRGRVAENTLNLQEAYTSRQQDALRQQQLLLRGQPAQAPADEGAKSATPLLLKLLDNVSPMLFVASNGTLTTCKVRQILRLRSTLAFFFQPGVNKRKMLKGCSHGECKACVLVVTLFFFLKNKNTTLFLTTTTPFFLLFSFFFVFVWCVAASVATQRG